MLIIPAEELSIYCYIGACLALLWGYEDPNDTLFLQSRIGYAILVGNCLVTWVRNMKVEVYLSAMEAIYILLGSLMIDILPLSMLVVEAA